jgi:hypothetical protein
VYREVEDDFEEAVGRQVDFEEVVSLSLSPSLSRSRILFVHRAHALPLSISNIFS